jgi:arsenate reductase (thioredoxin)
MEKLVINPVLQKLVSSLEKEEQLISESRKSELLSIANTIRTQLANRGNSDLVFVCTHNSRRSQLAELWMRVAVTFYGISHLTSWSGGTEVTAFNHRMVEALIRAGFDIIEDSGGANPRYRIRLNGDRSAEPMMFSKKYDDAYNPQTGFIAVMVCSQADQDCPFVPGASARISLPYEDPKNADDTPGEKAEYDAKVREIGREVLFLARSLYTETNT